VAAPFDALAVEGFVRTFLLDSFDTPADIPDFHRTMWADACGSAIRSAWAAPRDHAKSTSITLALPLAEALFGIADFFLIVSDTEGQAVKFLGDIKHQLQTNERIAAAFGVKLPFVKDTESEIVVEHAGGIFCMIAKGAEQKVRGLKWMNKRPNRIYVDDLENDESVSNENRRKKLRNWFLKALLPALSKSGKVRVVGTILHSDSLLERLLGSDHWQTRRFEAHNDDFSFILWPSRWSRAQFESIQAVYLEDGDPEGYFQEYRNKALDDSKSLFRKSDFATASREDLRRPLTYYLAGDLAVSEEERRDFTFLVVAGVDADGEIIIPHAEYGRWESDDIVEKLFELHKRFRFALMGFEKGPIQKTLGPFLRKEMRDRGTYLPLWTVASVRDKVARTTSIRARMRQGRVAFDREAEWFPALFWQMLRFPRDRYDDGVDAMSLLGAMLEYLREIELPPDDEDDLPPGYPHSRSGGRDPICGY
jgi:predicted phage terminase large subunit-like protein